VLELAELLLLGGAEAASATVQGEGVSTGSCTDAAMLRGMCERGGGTGALACHALSNASGNTATLLQIWSSTVLHKAMLLQLGLSKQLCALLIKHRPWLARTLNKVGRVVGVWGVCVCGCECGGSRPPESRAARRAAGSPPAGWCR
jgi:hypothetical protein